MRPFAASKKKRSGKEERKEYMNGDDLLLRDTMTATQAAIDTMAVRGFVNL